MSSLLIKILFFTAVFVENAVYAEEHDRLVSYDYCVVGGGAGGISAAVYAYDKGYSVLVLERQSIIGGHCDTRPATPPGPPSPTQPDWVDVGVQIFPDTFFMNVALNKTKNTGGWAVNSRAFFQRFTSVINFENSIEAVPHTNYAVDPEHGYTPSTPLPPQPAPDQAFFEAFGRLMAFYGQYPWLDNGQLEGPVPAELMGPWSQFVVAHNLSALSSVFQGFLQAGGLGNWDLLTTYFALRNLAPTLSQGIGIPGAFFVGNHGCQSLYDGIVNYIGAENVYTSVNITQVFRPKENRKNGRTVIRGTIPKPTNASETQRFVASCGQLVIGFAQTLAKLEVFDLDEKEQQFFANVKTRQYATGRINVAGPITATPVYNLIHLDVTRPFNNVVNSWLMLNVKVSYAPTNFLGFSDNLTTSADFRALVTAQLNLVPPTLITSFNFTELFFHEYYPYPSNADLTTQKGFYTKLEDLQGRRNTYWVGTLLSGLQAHHAIFDKSYRLAVKHFGSPHHPRHPVHPHQ
jgi:hypothetical protein